MSIPRASRRWTRSALISASLASAATTSPKRAGRRRHHLPVHVDKAAPSFVLNCLSATVASVVDAKVVKEHVAAVTPSATTNGQRLRQCLAEDGHAGPAFKLREWRANVAVVMERNDNYFAKRPLARIIYRNMKESRPRLGSKPVTSMLFAISSERPDAIAKNADLTTTSALRAWLITSASTRRTRTSPSPSAPGQIPGRL